jgi:hypothetical protein
LKWISSFSKRPRQVFVVHGEEQVAQYFAGFIGSKLDLSAWAPSPNESFDLLEEELPAAKEEKLWYAGLEDLKDALNRMDEVFSGIRVVSDRMKEHGNQVFKDPSSRDAQRLANAIVRFSEELESLRGRWDAAD